MAINIPVPALSLGYIQGLKLSNNATTPNDIVNVSEGQCRDSTGLYTLSLKYDATVNIESEGINGLDTGSVAASTFYGVYIVGDSSGENETGLLLSTSLTGAVTFPSGYDIFRRLGVVLTSGASAILVFDQRGNGRERTMTYRTSIATDITAGTATSFTAVNVSASIPVASITGIFSIALTPTGADDQIDLRCGDSTTDAAQATMSGSAAGVVKRGNLYCPIGATLASGVDYKLTAAGSTAINVQGYIDQL